MSDINVGKWGAPLFKYSNTFEYAPARDDRTDEVEYRTGALLEDNGHPSIRDINEASSDYAFLTAYWKEGKHPTEGGPERANIGDNYPLDMDFRVENRDRQLATLEQLRPKTSGRGTTEYGGLTITAGASVGVGPLQIGYSVDVPLHETNDPVVSREEIDYGLWKWTIDSDGTWPTDADTPGIDEDHSLPMVEFQIEPDAKDDGSDYRFVDLESKFNWRYTDMASQIHYRDTGYVGGTRLYHVIE